MIIRTYTRVYSRAAAAAAICLAGLVAMPATAHAFFYFQTGCQTTCHPTDLTAGPDGNMWFTDPTDGVVGRVATATGAISTFPVPGAPAAIITGPDNNLWVAESSGGKVAIVNTSGTVVTEVSVPAVPGSAGPTRLAVGPAVGPAGTVWFVDGDQVGSIVNVAPLTATLPVTLNTSLGDIIQGPDGHMWVTEPAFNRVEDVTAVPPVPYAIPQGASSPSRITVGSDGNLWFTDPGTNAIGEMNINAGHTITEYPIPTAASNPSAIAAGSDGDIWFTESATGAIGQFSPSTPNAITEFVPFSGTGHLDGIAPDVLGNLWTSDSATGVITLVEPSGRYVKLVYHDLLGRAPDSAGLAFWVNALDTDASPSQVAASFTGSYEYRAINVTADYNTLLNRGPDAAGLAFWVGYIGSGATYEDLEASLIASNEYYDVRGGGTVDGFVTAVYNDILHRAPDGPGLQYWAGQISSGVPRYVISESFSHTTEVLSNRVMADYQTLLRRAADPSGVTYWVGLLQHGTRDEQLIADLTGSTEYILYSALHPTP